MSGKTRAQLLAENLALQTRVTRLEAAVAKRRRGAPSPRDASLSHSTRVEQALRTSEARYRRIFEAAKDGILILDAETGMITDCNPSLEEMLGYSRKELLGEKLWETGPFKGLAPDLFSVEQLRSSEYVHYDDISLETKGGQHRQVELFSNLYLVGSWQVIQCQIRDITSRKLAETSIQRANEALSALVEALQRRDSAMTVLGRMNELLQTCETQEEAYRIIALTTTELFAGRSGCLAVFHSSGQYLETVSRWGEDPIVEDIFPVEGCWALRRGRPHEVIDPQTGLLCGHFTRPPVHGYLCLPLTVQGETLGVFHLSASEHRQDSDASQRQLAATAAEAIKLSLANLRMRMKLHEQATRDALTGLFNRRYLDDTLPRELHRTLRRGGTLCVAMLDLDHFKRFNDSFGHEAGDVLLRETGRVLRESLRKSDVACRYGGEEILLVLPDSSLADTSQRLEQIRRRFEAMKIHHEGSLLATMTFSGGVAAAPEHGTTPEELLRAADDALYAAKQAGRNRICAYQPGD